MAIAKRKIRPAARVTPYDEFADDLEFDLELAARFDPHEHPDLFGPQAHGHKVTESLDDE